MSLQTCGFFPHDSEASKPGQEAREARAPGRGAGGSWTQRPAGRDLSGLSQSILCCSFNSFFSDFKIISSLHNHCKNIDEHVTNMLI